MVGPGRAGPAAGRERVEHNQRRHVQRPGAARPGLHRRPDVQRAPAAPAGGHGAELFGHGDPLTHDAAAELRAAAWRL